MEPGWRDDMAKVAKDSEDATKFNDWLTNVGEFKDEEIDA